MQTTELAFETIRVCLRTRRGTAYARRYTLRASGPPFASMRRGFLYALRCSTGRNSDEGVTPSGTLQHDGNSEQRKMAPFRPVRSTISRRMHLRRRGAAAVRGGA